MTQYNLIAENPESTVVAEYQPLYRKETTFQSEADLEKAFIEQLQTQAYDYLPITSENELIANLRLQLEALNNYQFTNSEWEQFFKGKIANQNNGIEEKTTIIQEDHIQLLTRDDGTVKNIYLIDKANIHNNRLQVVNQYAVDNGRRANRYDVTVLVNGLPLVHIELKKRGVDIKEAFNQINRYNRESFWAGCGLFEYVQLFVISNGTYTKYYSNTTRSAHIKELGGVDQSKSKQTSNSFEFTSWWADGKNRPITDLMDFTKTFFSKHAILNILTKYCIFTSDKILMVMRPYQIAATERILARINTSNNYKNYGTEKGGGYIWHATGSGKTLTSFKTAQLASKLPYIDKVLFVVDRKDLDYQTMREYDKFEKGAANSNTSTVILARQLRDDKRRIIITTIQKLSKYVKSKNPDDAEVFNKHFVIIFDECHRSQFGEMHDAITRKFDKYHLFGFTGTPIFTKNAGGKGNLKTTEQAFGDRLHTYAIVDAINDKNVLPFRIDYIKTVKEEDDIKDKEVFDIDRERVLMAPERIGKIVAYILEHFDQKTKRNDRSYEFNVIQNIGDLVSAKDRTKVEESKKRLRLTGFNSILATSSIPAAKLYYTEFKKQMQALPSAKKLKVGLIYSYEANEGTDEIDGILDDENPEDTSNLDKSSRDFLEAAIKDYNDMFGTNYDTSSDKFQNYYKDVSLRMKNRDLDLLIVVNMFLTGFDATTLNTLWVDKNLRLHGLLQAFSRTNRILNSIKTFGNIVCFRNLQKATDDSIALFGDKNASGIVILKTYAEYYNGYADKNGKQVSGYKELIEELREKYPLGDPIIGETAPKKFISLFGTILRVRNILSSFDEFKGNEILSEYDQQDYTSVYINTYNDLRRDRPDKENINDDVVFEIELIKQVEVNIDYVLALIRNYHDEHQKNKEILLYAINKAIDSTLTLRDKKELIDRFVNSLTPEANVNDNWRDFVEANRKEDLDKIISEESLKKDETYAFVNKAFRDGYVQSAGTAFVGILPPMSRFGKNSDRSQKIETVLEKIKAFFNKYFNISNGMMNEE